MNTRKRGKKAARKRAAVRSPRPMRRKLGRASGRRPQVERRTPAALKKRRRSLIRKRKRIAAAVLHDGSQQESTLHVNADLLERAVAAGAEAGQAIRGLSGSVDKSQLQQNWSLWLSQAVPGSMHLDIYASLMRAYLGAAHADDASPPDWVLLPEAGTVSCILTAMNEERTIGGVLEQLIRLPMHEIIVVVNGSADRTRDIAEMFEAVKVVHYEKALGHDVGRTLGAKAATGDLLLFMDADFAVPGELLLPFFLAVRGGADIVLNDISPFVSRFDRRDEVTVMKEFLNHLLNRRDLSVNSLTAVPHVMTRHAADTIGLEKLAVPPLAQVRAVEAGLRIANGGQVNVVKHNRLRTSNTGVKNPVADMIIGDHMEALSQLIKLQGPRLVFPDTVRKRRK